MQCSLMTTLKGLRIVCDTSSCPCTLPDRNPIGQHTLTVCGCNCALIMLFNVCTEFKQTGSASLSLKKAAL